MTYKLICTETGRKSGKYHYQVIDENGNVISERHSNREYVACVANGSLYFGRLDLIGKGEHGSNIKYFERVLAGLVPGTTFSKEAAQRNLDALNLIAYR